MTESSARITASTVSWLRAYHTGHAVTSPAKLLAPLESTLELTAIAPDPGFYDIQVLRRGHVARARFADVPVTLCLAAGRLTARIAAHVLLHSSGFALFRLTMRSDHVDDLPPSVAMLRGAERLMWEPGDSQWHFGGVDVIGNVRVAMNYLFLRLIAGGDRTDADAATCAGRAAEGPHGCDWLHELHVDGRLPYPYPVSFGTSFEVVADRLDPLGADAFAQQLLGRDAGAAPARDIEHDNASLWWYLEENQALVLRPDGEIGDLDLVDPDRGQLLEYLTLRRAALRSVQRDSQVVLTENAKVSRRRLDSWSVVVATTTDDYVLHDRVGCLLVPLREHLDADRRLRDLAELEDQVRSNLETFRGRLDSLSSSVTALVGALFAVLAVTLTTGGLARAVVAKAYGLTPSRFDRAHPIVSGAVGPIIVLVSAALALGLMRALSTSVRPTSGRA